MKNVEEVFEVVKNWSKADRQMLVDWISADSTADENEDIEAAWDDEIARRVAEIKSGDAKTVPADEVLRKAREILGR